MAERLTIKVFDNNGKQQDIYEWSSASSLECNKKLGRLEDIMEKYGIESVEELDLKLEYYLDKIETDKFNYENLFKYKNELKKDRDNWKRACELACKWFKQTGFIGDQTKVDYFYQQAKKEGVSR